jgi:hypothetical protein
MAITYQLFSKSFNKLVFTTQITLSIPLEGEECPLTLESIKDSQLSCLPNTSFFIESPLHNKLTLPCGHSFSALTLVYSFLKTSMTCPLCRDGKHIQADIRCLPPHLSNLKKTIQRNLEMEHRLDEEMVLQDLHNIYHSQFTEAFLTAEFFINDLFILSLNVLMRSDGSRMIPTNSLRNWGQLRLEKIRFSLTVGGMRIDSTAITPIQNGENIVIPSLTTQSNFTVVFTGLRLNTIVWNRV